MAFTFRDERLSTNSSPLDLQLKANASHELSHEAMCTGIRSRCIIASLTNNAKSRIVTRITCSNQPFHPTAHITSNCLERETVGITSTSMFHKNSPIAFSISHHTPWNCQRPLQKKLIRSKKMTLSPHCLYAQIACAQNDTDTSHGRKSSFQAHA